MSTTARSRLAGAPASTVAALVLLALGVLTGCSAGQITQTSSQVPSVNGASGQVGPIAVRNAVIASLGTPTSAAVYGVGGSAPLSMVIVNQGTQDDVLLSVSSPIAGSGLIGGDATLPAGHSLTVTGGLPAAPQLAGQASASRVQPSGSLRSSSSAQVSASTTPSSSTAPSITQPVTTRSADPLLGTNYVQIALTGLRQDVLAGLTYPVVLTFQKAGRLQIEMPVANPAGPPGSAE